LTPAPFPGPRRARGWDDSRATPPTRPPKVRTVLLILAAYCLALGALAIGGGIALSWWRSS